VIAVKFFTLNIQLSNQRRRSRKFAANH